MKNEIKEYLGTIKFLIKWAIFYTLFLLVWPMDDTDKDRFNRSGISIHTDCGTGLQYVKSGFFGDIIPRLDKNGKQIVKECNKQ